MHVGDAPLAEAVTDLRQGHRSPVDYVAARYDRVEAVEDDVAAWVNGPKPREWTESEAAARQGREQLRTTLEAAMDDHGIDVRLSPAAPGPVPKEIDDTGDPVMNLPWTHAGLPTVSLPAGEVDGLPVGLQCAGQFGADERLLAWNQVLTGALRDG